MSSERADPPYAGLRVLELARVLAGPWIGQALADLAAEVIKVESPEGDERRRWGPPFLENADGSMADAAYFHACNRGKDSLVLDLRDPADRERVHPAAERVQRFFPHLPILAAASRRHVKRGRPAPADEMSRGSRSCPRPAPAKSAAPARPVCLR